VIRFRQQTSDGGDHGCEGDFGKEICCTAEWRGTRAKVGNQVLTLSHRKLLSSKAMVVNVAETQGQDSGRQG
jgi:hypothetical protein